MDSLAPCTILFTRSKPIIPTVILAAVLRNPRPPPAVLAPFPSPPKPVPVFCELVLKPSKANCASLASLVTLSKPVVWKFSNEFTC